MASIGGMDTKATRRSAVTIAGQRVALVVRRHPRAKRLILRLAAAEDGVVVTIPPSAAFEDAAALALRHADWIAGRLAARPARVVFEPGAVVPLRGRDHRVCHRAGAPAGILAEPGAIHIGGTARTLAARLHAWLRDQARCDLSAHATALAPATGRSHGRITVRDPRARWGSCAASGELSFSWRLVLAPSFVLRYVVAHELAHLVERNHGPRFWALVEALAGDVSDSRGWLKRHGPGLHRYG